MLFGASIEKLPEGDGYRLRLKKSTRRWPQLGWAVIVAESQDTDFKFLRFHIATRGPGCLEFKSPGSCFMEAAWNRWYGSGEKRIPAGIEMDDKAMTFWLLGHWGSKTPILPRLGCDTVPLRMPGTWVVGPRHKKVFELTGGRKDVEGWLRERIPEQIWSNEAGG